MPLLKTAVIQRAPTYLHRDETVRAAVAGIAEATVAGAKLVVFPEALTPGYQLRVNTQPQTPLHIE